MAIFKSGFLLPAPTTLPPAAAAAKPAASTVIAPFYFEVSGKNIPANIFVRLIGVEHSWGVGKYPEQVVQVLKNCKILVSELMANALGDVQANIRRLFIQHRMLIQGKYDSMDETWMRQQMQKLGYPGQEQAQIIATFKEKKQKLTSQQEPWHKRLSPEVCEDLQKILDSYGLKLNESHPLLVEDIVAHKINTRNQPDDALEMEMLKHFQRENRAIIELDDNELMTASFFGSFIQFMNEFDLEETIDSIQIYLNQLVTGCFEDDGVETYGDALAKNEIPLDLESFKNEEEGDRGTICRNIAWQPKYLQALSLGQPTAIIMGYAHLQGTSGALKFLESQGYTVNRITSQK